DRGQSIATATAAPIVGASFSVGGVISNTAETDYYRFTTGAGRVNLSVDVAAIGAMLDATLELRDANNNVIDRADSTSLGELLSVSVAAGTYYAVVRSHGSYGDLGQYTL